MSKLIIITIMIISGMECFGSMKVFINLKFLFIVESFYRCMMSKWIIRFEVKKLF